MPRTVVGYLCPFLQADLGDTGKDSETVYAGVHEVELAVLDAKLVSDSLARVTLKGCGQHMKPRMLHPRK